jgi:hypothetical protein
MTKGQLLYALNSVSVEWKHKRVLCWLLCETKPVRIMTSKVWLMKLTDAKSSLTQRNGTKICIMRETESAP